MRRISKMQKYIPMIYEQLWNICKSIRKSDPIKYKALFKDLMKLEKDKYYTIKEKKNERRPLTEEQYRDSNYSINTGE